MTARLAVFGNPVSHSRSPEIHAAFGEMAGIDLTYEKILVPEGEFAATATEFLKDGTGFNITVPCKNDAFRFVDHLTDKAQVSQAVNTVSRDKKGELVGSNTDGGGLVRDLTRNLGWQIRDQRVLVIGAGGAVSGVLMDLLGESPESVDLCNRTHARAVELGERFGVNPVPAGELGRGYDLIINGTSAGLSGQDPEVPGYTVSEHSQCYDMIYGPGVTRFNAWCQRQANCPVSDGLGMLVEQAALAFEIWFGEKVDTSAVIARIRADLN